MQRAFCLGLASAITLLLVPCARSADPPPDYATQVAPIFTKYCVGCHNLTDHEGKLSLESFAELQKGGTNGTAILPGEGEASRMIRMLTGELEPKMPPEGSEAPTAEEVAILKAWIDGGAKGPDGAEPDRRVLLTPKLTSAPEGDKPITALALSPDGSRIALGAFTRVTVIDASTHSPVLTLSDFPGKVNAVNFSKDGTRLVVASGVAGLYGHASIWTLADGNKLREFSAHRDTLYDAELSPDGTILATCSYDRKVFLWNAESGEQIRALEGHNDAIYDLAFSPDGTVLATASGDSTVKLWRVDSGERLDTLSQPEKEQYTVAFSPDGQYVIAGGADNRIRVWRFVSRDKPQINPLVFARFAHEGAIVKLAYSRDGSSLVSAAEDRTIKVWETKTYTERHLLDAQPVVVSGVGFSAMNDAVFVGRVDGELASLALPLSQPEATISEFIAPVIARPVGVAPMTDLTETEPNDTIVSPTNVILPAKISATIYATAGQPEDVDHYRFEAKAGEQWVIEINAARQKSPLDSYLEVLTAEGKPIERVLLQAVRDSYFTFRGKDSDTSDDFRVHNWEEMDLNEYLYSNGEVVKLWLYPRGPDSGFKVYPGVGKRYTHFDTTAISHPLGEPCYIVVPYSPDVRLIPNGLPTFPVYYENDDDSLRRYGADSRLTFTAPQDGAYIVRVSDARGLGGEAYKYDLIARPREPDFQVTLGGADPTVNAGSAKEFTVSTERFDDFEGEIRIDIQGLPPGFAATTPVVIQAGQNTAIGVVYALPDAVAPTAENAITTKVTATAEINGQSVTKDVNNLGTIKLAEKPKLLARIVPAEGEAPPQTGAEPGQFPTPWEIVVAPGTTVTAKVIVERNGFDGRVEFGNEDSGRNLPHGVYIDNIGLNGLLIVEGQTERTFFVTAAGFVPETTRLFHLRAKVEGEQATWPVLVHIKK